MDIFRLAFFFNSQQVNVFIPLNNLCNTTLILSNSQQSEDISTSHKNDFNIIVIFRFVNKFASRKTAFVKVRFFNVFKYKLNCLFYISNNEKIKSGAARNMNMRSYMNHKNHS